MWFSKISGSKLTLLLDKHELESSSDSKDDEVGNEMLQFSEDVEEFLLILSEEV